MGVKVIERVTGQPDERDYSQAQIRTQAQISTTGITHQLSDATIEVRQWGVWVRDRSDGDDLLLPWPVIQSVQLKR